MIPAESAIHRVRRDITLSMVLKAVLVLTIAGCLLFAPPALRFSAIMIVVGVWIGLSVTSARSSRLGGESPLLIATGRYDEAEKQIDLAMRAFSIFAPAKLRTLHQLAVLRHAQHRWGDAAALSAALLRQRPGLSRSLARPARLILAESSLELNDIQGGYAAIDALYRQPLSLEESLQVLLLQLDYESRVGAWQKMFHAAAEKVQLAELMQSPGAARVQAFLALAALKCGRTDWANWLVSRVELLSDVQQLVRERGIFAELWPQTAPPPAT